jgi:hypothetical protein
VVLVLSAIALLPLVSAAAAAAAAAAATTTTCAQPSHINAEPDFYRSPKTRRAELNDEK